MIGDNKSPNFIIDTTTAGKTTDALKSFTKNLGIPTVSLSYGQSDDLRYISL